MSANTTAAEDVQTIDFVILDQRLAIAHALLHPPKDLHPFLRLLFYRRFMTPELLSYYEQTRQKIKEIYEKAKSGLGKIRYNDQIYDLYLPLPGEMGRYELVELNTSGSGGQPVNQG